MKWFLLTHFRKLFWVWSAVGIVFLVVGLNLRPDLPLTLYLLSVIWIEVGAWSGNLLARWMCRQAFRQLDEACDPEPLLEVSRAVLKQNPGSCIYRVYEAWALALLGRQQEAETSIEYVERRRRLWRNPMLLMMCGAALSDQDPRQEKVTAALERLAKRGSRKRRALIHQVLEGRNLNSQVSQAPAELEPMLCAALERASCTREQVGAHLALGLYYIQQKRMDLAQEHISFVAAHGNKLQVRVEAERLLCCLPTAP
ncbi:MAG: hypothetical protein ACOX7N_01540 [Lawsonibacter sp.]|jgi:hypothetical protein